ncbi:hypothetical protein BpHYR1_051266 [Brachionus plicatilis]|uniref:Uncharacterized protein n=1 Tax=Brachionus plicatilis TaxID=10195 RepID=A0A3M7SR44_BRAPC|nr:hypothetical protein BpHYR1_051266 [Brachionus plicatilis]
MNYKETEVDLKFATVEQEFETVKLGNVCEQNDENPEWTDVNISSKIEKGMKESSVIHNQIESDIPSLQIRLILRFSLSWFIFTLVLKIDKVHQSEEVGLFLGRRYEIPKKLL